MPTHPFARRTPVQALPTLGMSAAFDLVTADYTGIGTEAAAATAVIIGTTSMPENVIALDIDRPFLYFLQDRATGALLFVGRVADPRLSSTSSAC